MCKIPQKHQNPLIIQGQENNYGIVVSLETTIIILYHMGTVKPIHS